MPHILRYVLQGMYFMSNQMGSIICLILHVALTCIYHELILILTDDICTFKPLI